MSEDTKHTIQSLINTEILPEFIKTRQAVLFLNHKTYTRKKLYKERQNLKGIRIGKGKNYVFPIKEIIKLKQLIN